MMVTKALEWKRAERLSDKLGDRSLSREQKESLIREELSKGSIPWPRLAQVAQSHGFQIERPRPETPVRTQSHALDSPQPNQSVVEDRHGINSVDLGEIVGISKTNLGLRIKLRSGQQICWIYPIGPSYNIDDEYKRLYSLWEAWKAR